MNNNENLNNENKNNNTKSIKILLIILIILVLVVLVLLVYKMFFYKSKPRDNQSTRNNVVDEVKENNNIVEDVKDDNNEEDKKEEQQVVYNGKKISIYYDKENNYYSCSNIYKNSKVISTMKCISNNCECKEVSKDNVLVKEDNQYSLYNYHDNKIIFSDIAKGYSFDDEEGFDLEPTIQTDSNKNVIALLYVKNGKSTIYSVLSNKIYKDVKGYLPMGPTNVDSSKFNNNGLLYLVNYQDENYENIIFDLNTGKSHEFSNSINFVGDSYFITKTDKSFRIYDYKLNEKYNSKEYDEVLMTGKDFALVVENTNLNLIDLKGNLLTTFIEDFNKEKYYVHTMLSGWYEQNNKNGIYIVIGEYGVTKEEILKDNPNMTSEDVDGYINDNDINERSYVGYEYYYVPKTKEKGKIATVIGGYAKPVLYLYPEERTKVKVSFEHNELLTTTYPKFVNNWEVMADKDGNLTDKNGRNYYALYWEELKNHDIDFKEGFYVEGRNAIEFLEEKLAFLGLNERESNEFIMYWLPILEKNDKNLIYFELTEERDKYNKLIITPKPDSILRIAMHVKKINNKVNIKEQKLPIFNRVGFTAIEWGGVIH